MKIGILYICTGKYTIFWKDFYLSCEKNFVTKTEKHYFVFTDSNIIEFENTNPNIHLIHQDNLGWPNNTLKRYEIFLNSKEKIIGMDYLFYLNANLLFLEEVSEKQFLPSNREKLVACLHPGYFNKQIKKYPYENNPLSKAYLDRKSNMKYFAGGINGGETKHFMKVMEILKENINNDSKNNIMAKWHDESHWNWYLNNNLGDVKILDPSYLYPEGSNVPFIAKILIRDKRLLGGHSKLRNKLELKLFLSRLKIYTLKIFNLK